MKAIIILIVVSVCLSGKLGCLYRGNIYKQGQTWEDGCDFSYHMYPPTACNCCPTPDCSDGVDIQYPPAQSI
ncbi:hypothetical protein ACF0H5_005856 [Mactra antiquata]